MSEPVRPSVKNPVRSRVKSTVDLDKEGKQVGALLVPHSRNDSAWGSLPVPICVVRNGPGPTALLCGGNHGDEYEGQLSLAKLARTLAPEHIAGRVIILPMLNYPAAQAGTRVSPVDGVNLNRAFPGRYDGGVTEMIAHYVDAVLLPEADAVLDLHSGGTSLEFVPSAVAHRLPDKAQQARCLAALKAFGAPLGLVVEELDDKGMLDTAAEEKGATFVSTELGGGGRVGRRALEVAERGVRGFLTEVGVLQADLGPLPEAGSSRLVEVAGEGFVIAAGAGLFEPLVDLGEEVREGQPVGQLFRPDALGAEPELVRARVSGVVWGQRALARVAPGDCLVVVAADLDEASLG